MTTLVRAIEDTVPTVGLSNIYLSSSLKKGNSFRYKNSGKASLNTDYTISLSSGATPRMLSVDSGKIVLDSGIDNIKLSINPLNDALVEGMEDVTFTILEPLYGYALKDSTAVVPLSLIHI